MTSRCPYCAEEIAGEAVVCKHCGRDLFLLKPLMEKVEALTAQVAALEAQLGTPADDGVGAALAASPAAVTAPEAVRPAHRRWLAPVVAILVLLAAHLLIVLALDLRLVYLRLVSLVVPFAAGFLFRRTAAASLWVDGLVGLAVAACAIAGMLAAVSLADGIAFLPQSKAEWLEVGQYAFSIAAGFFAGALLRQVALLASGTASESGAIATLARLLGAEIVGSDEAVPLEKRLKRTEQILTTTFATVAAVFSAILGLARLFD